MDRDERKVIMILIGIGLIFALIAYFLVVPDLPKPNEFFSNTTIIARR